MEGRSETEETEIGGIGEVGENEEERGKEGRRSETKNGDRQRTQRRENERRRNGEDRNKNNGGQKRVTENGEIGGERRTERGEQRGPRSRGESLPHTPPRAGNARHNSSQPASTRAHCQDKAARMSASNDGRGSKVPRRTDRELTRAQRRAQPDVTPVRATEVRSQQRYGPSTGHGMRSMGDRNRGQGEHECRPNGVKQAQGQHGGQSTCETEDDQARPTKPNQVLQDAKLTEEPASNKPKKPDCGAQHRKGRVWRKRVRGRGQRREWRVPRGTEGNNTTRGEDQHRKGRRSIPRGVSAAGAESDNTARGECSRDRGQHHHEGRVPRRTESGNTAGGR